MCPAWTGAFLSPILCVLFLFFCFNWRKIALQCFVGFCYTTALINAQSCPTLQPHGLQHARLPCSSASPGVCSNSCHICPSIKPPSHLPILASCFYVKKSQIYRKTERILYILCADSSILNISPLSLLLFSSPATNS